MYTSLELSKKLDKTEAYKKLESRVQWRAHCHPLTGETFGYKLIHGDDGVDYDTEANAYDILYDICVKYAKEFFYKDESSEENNEIGDPLWKQHTINVLRSIQYGDIEQAEYYIWENCNFNKKNDK